MGMLSVSSCCCFDLHTGGLIIGYIEVFISTLFVCGAFSGPVSNTIIWSMLPILISAFWVYGVHYRRHGFMVPSIVVWAIVFVFFMSLLVIIPILQFGFDYQMHEQLGILADEASKYYTPIFLGIFIVWAILTSIIWSITAVKYSLYQHVKIATYGRNADLYGHNECINIAV